MTSGKPVRNLWFALLLWIGNADAAPLTLDDLLAGFAGVEVADARFEEKLILAITESPLTSTGVLSYRRPDYLKKEVLEPSHSLFEISGDRVIVETEQERRTLSLDSQPAIRAFAEAYRATLAGDRKALERHYEVELSGAAEQWSLRLQPLDARIRSFVRSIEFSGSGTRILRIETQEASGDFSVMSIKPNAE